MQYTDSELVAMAIDVAGRAYAPYSKFHVGAILVGADGRTFAGCNVENISFGLTICAERNAVFAAVAAGCREFTKMVIVADTKEPASPCGACPRQVTCLPTGGSPPPTHRRYFGSALKFHVEQYANE